MMDYSMLMKSFFWIIRVKMDSLESKETLEQRERE